MLMRPTRLKWQTTSFYSSLKLIKVTVASANWSSTVGDNSIC